MSVIKVVVALGGNALQESGKPATAEEQLRVVNKTAEYLAEMSIRGYEMAVVHGNGPQVGRILLASETAAGVTPVMPFDVCGAMSQGYIGYHIQQGLREALRKRGRNIPVVTLVTQVVVDKDDPGFKNPTKGIGGFANEASARRFEAEGWIVQEDAGRGWRRVIASPIPRRIVELDAIRGLVDMGYVVISVGGGGIPVFENQKGELRGCVGAMGAVIDKDRASGLLAAELGVDLLLISTGVEQVAINFNKPNQQWLDRLTLAEAKRYHAEGHFLKGSMGPKIEAAIEYLEKTPHGQALITNPENIARALAGETGTWIANE